MNAYALFAADEALRLANRRVAELRIESARHQVAAGDRSSRRRWGPIRAAMSTLRTVLSADDLKPVLPTLTDYPYRS